jgi:AcrR family transcriptional regulator
MATDRKRTNDPEGLRGRVLDAAAVAFQARGYHATSTHDVMRQAGVSGGAFHHHFPTKKALALAVIHERVASAVETTWIAPMRAAPTLKRGVLAIFEAIATSLERHGEVLGCPLNNIANELARADPDFQHAVEAIYERWKRTIVERAREGASGGLRARQAEELATLIVAAYSGAIGLAKTHQNALPLRMCARQLSPLLDIGS